MIDDIDINKIVVSYKVSFGPLSIFLSKMDRYRGDFYETKCMSFLIKDEKL